MAYIESICGDKNDIIVKSFSQATDEEITEYLNLHRAGKINLYDFWTVGEERIVHLDAMPSYPVSSSTYSVDQTFVILHGPNAFDLSDEEGGGKNIFVIGLSNDINNFKYSKNNNTYYYTSYKMNSSSSNVGGWNSSDLKSWINDSYREALPTEVKKWFKKFKYKSSDGGGLDTSSVIESYLSIPSYYEVYGEYAVESETGIQFDWYKNKNNTYQGYITSISGGSMSLTDVFSWLRTSVFDNSTNFYYMKNPMTSINSKPNYAANNTNPNMPRIFGVV